MAVYAWPTDRAWWPRGFELRILPNTRVFVGSYTPTTQVLDMMGERWQGRIELSPARNGTEVAAREAFMDRLFGPANQFAIWHFGQPAALGTVGDAPVGVSVVNASAAAVTVVNASAAVVSVVSGTPVLRYAVPQFAGTATIQSRPGRTVLAGSMLGLGGVQTVRVLADATADSNGLLVIEFAPRARAAIPAYAAFNTVKPTINVMLKAADGVPTTWRADFADAAAFEFIEVP